MTTDICGSNFSIKTSLKKSKARKLSILMYVHFVSVMYSQQQLQHTRCIDVAARRTGVCLKCEANNIGFNFKVKVFIIRRWAEHLLNNSSWGPCDVLLADETHFLFIFANPKAVSSCGIGVLDIVLSNFCQLILWMHGKTF